MNTDQRRIVRGRHVAHPKNHAFLDLVSVHALKTVDAEMAESTGEIRFRDLGQHGEGGRFHYNDPEDSPGGVIWNRNNS